jgi:hypothetical protein
MSNPVLIRPKPQTEPPCSHKIPLYIRLSDRLTSPAEAACARAVAGYLSGRLGRVVSLAELEGLSLYLWSEHDVEGRPLADYANGDRPLQALLLKTCDHPGERECDRLASAELGRFVGQRFLFAVELPLCA